MEGRDAACIERDRAVQGEKDAVQKYEELLSRWDTHTCTLTSPSITKQHHSDREVLLANCCIVSHCAIELVQKLE